MPDPTPRPRSVPLVAAIVVAALAVLFGVMVGLGALLTHPLKDNWPVDEEDGVNRALARGRTPTLNDVSWFLGQLGNTLTVIGLMLVVAVVLRLWLKRWLPSLFVVLAVSAQALVFMCTQFVISRDRPEVRRLDASPPTSSYPSGHTGAAIALYGATALVVLWYVRKPLVRALLAVLLLAIPVGVAYARLYRGMHHPTDIAGSLVNGASSILISARAVLTRDRYHDDGGAHIADRDEDPRRGPARAASGK